MQDQIYYQDQKYCTGCGRPWNGNKQEIKPTWGLAWGLTWRMWLIGLALALPIYLATLAVIAMLGV